MVRPPEGYVRDAEIMFAIVQCRCAAAATMLLGRPLFRLGPRDIAICAPLDVLGPRMAKNDAARLLVREAVERTGGRATCMMLAMALEHAGVPVERVSLGELGLGDVGKT